MLPATARALGCDPHARACAAKLLRRLLRRFTLEDALAAWCWGSGRVTRGERQPASVRLFVARVLDRAGMQREQGEVVASNERGAR